MYEVPKKLYAKIASNAAHYICDAVHKHLPASLQKDFMLWILADNNQYQNDYLKMLGVANSIELEIAMLNGIIHNQDILQKVISYLGYLNAYFAFETIQDNIAIGMADWFQSNNASQTSQRKLIQNFNTIMIRKLEGYTKSTNLLLAPYANIAEKFSAYKRCLSPIKMYEFAKAYNQKNRHNSLSELEYCFYPILLLNVETCVNLLNALRHHMIHPYLQEALIARYSSVNTLLNEASYLNSTKLSDLGAKTILVLPTLVFCIGALDLVSPNPGLKHSLDDGSLMQGIYNSALLVRLLNDLGTNILTLDKTEQTVFFDNLYQLAQQRKFTSFIDLLLHAGNLPQLNKLMARIRKDVQYGEFNVCLDNIENIHNIPKALQQFCENILFNTELYQEHSKNLVNTCKHIGNHFGDNKVSQLIFNMFKYHEKMYSIKFESVYGDYAILNEGNKKNEKSNHS